MASKPKWVPPAEDVTTFYEAMLSQLNLGGCNSTRDASERAFTSLRQRGGTWCDKPYGPSVTQTIIGEFNDQQLESLAAFFPKAQRETTRQDSSITEKFAKDPELRVGFLTSVATDKSRPRLAVEFGIPLELVSLAFENAIKGQPRTGYKAEGYKTYESTLTSSKIINVASQRPEWARLADLKFLAGTTRIPGWTNTPSHEEIDIYSKLKFEADKNAGTVASGEVPIGTALSGGTYGGGRYTQQVASSHIGNGGKITR